MALADWGAIWRAASTRFRPTREQITDETKPKMLMRQLTSPSPPVQDAPGRKLSTDPHVEQQDAVDAVQRGYERPATTRTVELAVHTSATGQVLAIDVILPSGSAQLDGEAMQALRDAFAAYPPQEERRPMLSRWRVRAGYAVTLPKALAPMTDRAANARTPSRGIPLLVPFWQTFDANGSPGSSQTNHAFAGKIETQVELLSQLPE